MSSTTKPAILLQVEQELATSDGRDQTASEMMLLDQMNIQQTMPVFGSDNVLNKSPYVAIPEDFVAYLFNSSEGAPITGVPIQGYK
jgi:hypothetical protein